MALLLNNILVGNNMSNNYFDFSGKIALVSGASRGIGQAVAAKLAENGAIVIGTATTEAGALAISKDLSIFTNPGKGLVLDVTNLDSVESTFDKINEFAGRPPDILINNAGIAKDNLLMRMKHDDWSLVIDTNLTGSYNLIKANVRSMVKARFGRIINIGSVVGTMGNPGQANYSAAKAGLLGLSKSLARELGSRGITVNTVAPGYIITDMTDKMSDDQKEQLEKQIPLQRLGTVDDIANAVLFLASPLADYISGETLHINGGMYMI